MFLQASAPSAPLGRVGAKVLGPRVRPAAAAAAAVAKGAVAAVAAATAAAAAERGGPVAATATAEAAASAPSTHPPAASATAVESPAAAATAAATAAGAPAALVVLGGRVGADELAVLVADESALALRLRHGARDDDGIVASGCSAAGQVDRAAKGASAGRERAGAARAERRVSGLNPRRGDREHGRVSAHSRELEGFACTRSWSAAVPNEEPLVDSILVAF